MADKRQDIPVAVVDNLPPIATVPVPSLVVLRGTPDTIYQARQSSVEGTYEWELLGYADAALLTITDSGGYYSGSTVEAALQEIGPFLGWTTIAEGLTGEAVSAITFSSLTSSLYRLTLYVNQITSDCTVEMFFNNDTGTNYIDGDGTGENSISISAAIADEHALVDVLIAKPASTEEAAVVATYIYAATSSSVSSGTAPGQWTNTDAKITRIDVAPTAGQFGSQTYYKLEGSG